MDSKNGGSLDKIIFEKLCFYGYHGHFRHEQLRGQPFELDLELHCDLRPAGRSDSLTQGIDYSEVYRYTKEIVCHRRFRLLEALGECLCCEILERFTSVQLVNLRLRKPQAPLEGGILRQLDYVEGAPPPVSLPPSLPPWQPGSFARGGSVGIQVQRTRQELSYAAQEQSQGR